MSNPADDGNWLTIHETESSRVQFCDLGDGRTAVRTQHFSVEAVMDANAEYRAAQAGKSWDNGAVIGRMPTSLYFASGMAEARKNGDEEWIKRFWNDRDHYRLRTKEGHI